MPGQSKEVSQISTGGRYLHEVDDVRNDEEAGQRHRGNQRQFGCAHSGLDVPDTTADQGYGKYRFIGVVSEYRVPFALAERGDNRSIRRIPPNKQQYFEHAKYDQNGSQSHPAFAVLLRLWIFRDRQQFVRIGDCGLMRVPFKSAGSTQCAPIENNVAVAMSAEVFRCCSATKMNAGPLYTHPAVEAFPCSYGPSGKAGQVFQEAGKICAISRVPEFLGFRPWDRDSLKRLL